jgi:hypothetical protein
MTENEKLIWAATYSAEYIRQIKDQSYHGISVSVSMAIETAWDAVVSARGAHEDVREGWGEDDEVYQMLCEMIPEAK